MHRIRLTLPPGSHATFQTRDLVHDAIVAALVARGVAPDLCTGREAHPWTFATLGRADRTGTHLHSLVIATPDQELGGALRTLKPQELKAVRTRTGEMIDLAPATLTPDPAPVVPQSRVLPVLTLSPIVISLTKGPKKTFLTTFDTMRVTAAANDRLSRLAGRPVALRVEADSLYLRTHPQHSRRCVLKIDSQGRPTFVFGLVCPLLLCGAPEDSTLAWYAGLGEKTRMGFGCLGPIDQGIGRRW